MNEINVGDRLYCIGGVLDGKVIRIETVDRITPSGRIVTDKTTQINPDLSIRGANKWGPYRMKPVTPDIEEAYKKQEVKRTLLGYLATADFNAMPVETLIKLLDIIKAAEEGK